MFSAGIFGDLGFNDTLGSYYGGSYRIQSELNVLYGIAKDFQAEFKVSWKVWGYLPVIVRNELDVSWQVIGGIRSELNSSWQIRNVRQTELSMKWYVQGDSEPTVVKNKLCVPKPVSTTIKIC